jgi:hypothetical protein
MTKWDINDVEMLKGLLILNRSGKVWTNLPRVVQVKALELERCEGRKLSTPPDSDIPDDYELEERLAIQEESREELIQDILGGIIIKKRNLG